MLGRHSHNGLDAFRQSEQVVEGNAVSFSLEVPAAHVDGGGHPDCPPRSSHGVGIGSRVDAMDRVVLEVFPAGSTDSLDPLVRVVMTPRLLMQVTE